MSMYKAGGISIHAVDVAAGRPAEGMRVELLRLEPQPQKLAEGRLAASGAFDHATARGEGITVGRYEVLFHVGEWLAGQERDGRFLDIVPFRFSVDDASQHFHLPFKFTPWGFSLFRGS
jgi:5-hydroxyisourate hydrolase